MKSLTLFALIFLFLMLTGGCGSPAGNESNNVAVTNANPAPNSGLVPYAPAPVNTSNANAAAAVNPVPSSNSNSSAKPKMMTFPAPDDSEYFTSMDKSGMAIETRVFHSDPQIAKVTRTWKSVNDKMLNIYLKNGKVIKLSGDPVPNLNTAPVGAFVTAAGLKPPAAPASNSGPPDQKIKSPNQLK